MKNFLMQDCYIFLEEKFRQLTAAYHKVIDNRADGKEDEQAEREYLILKNEFERQSDIIKEYSDCLDIKMKTFKIDEETKLK